LVILAIREREISAVVGKPWRSWVGLQLADEYQKVCYRLKKILLCFFWSACAGARRYYSGARFTHETRCANRAIAGCRLGEEAGVRHFCRM